MRLYLLAGLVALAINHNDGQPTTLSCPPAEGRWSCCSSSKPCAIGDGDCDDNEDCLDSICGENNCGYGDMDCCMEDPLATEEPESEPETEPEPETESEPETTSKPDNWDCAPSNNDWNCCSVKYGRRCGHMEGDCDRNADCLGGHFCGDNNCNTYGNTGAVYGMDCCERIATTTNATTTCAPSNNNWNCCSVKYGRRCGHMEGDCDRNEDCLRGHFCGDNNCNTYGNSGVVDGMDCCERIATDCNGDDDCCDPSNKCKDGEGDCDKDEDCDSGLVCGNDNCHTSDTDETFDDSDDCCMAAPTTMAPTTTSAAATTTTTTAATTTTTTTTTTTPATTTSTTITTTAATTTTTTPTETATPPPLYTTTVRPHCPDVTCVPSVTIYRSIGIAVDNTESASNDANGIKVLTNRIIEAIGDQNILENFRVPTWVLTTFNDAYPYTDDITQNTELRVVSNNSSVIRESFKAVTFSGGDDPPERLTQGVELTMLNLPKHSVLLAFTDNPTKNLELGADLIKMRDEKDIRVFIILAPKYRGITTDESWKLYQQLADGRVFNMDIFTVDNLLKEVVDHYNSSCATASCMEAAAAAVTTTTSAAVTTTISAAVTTTTTTTTTTTPAATTSTTTTTTATTTTTTTTTTPAATTTTATTTAATTTTTTHAATTTTADRDPTTTTDKTAAYCTIDSLHTMCLHSGPSVTCAAKTLLRGMDQTGKDAILTTHNDLRRKVASGEQTGQPAASNMRELVWEEELEMIAQRWADQCSFEHDSKRTKLDGTSVGQNVYISGNTVQSNQAGLTAEASVPAQKWYDEVTDPGFNSANINPFQFDVSTGHYTQVVWAETYQIGCANVYYSDGQFFKNLVVCNYAVAGNLPGSSMYSQGATCSSCPAGTSCVDSLCRAG